MKTDTTSILDIAYPEVVRALSINSNLLKYKQFISKFVQQPKRQEVIFSSIPLRTYYSTEDVNNWFISTSVDKNIIKQAIKGTYYYSIANFNPRYAKDESTIALLCMVKYFLDNNMENELNLSLVNICFSGKFYPSIFSGKFRFDPSPQIMEYVVNQMMDNKFALIRYGSLINSIKAMAQTWIETYGSDRFKDFTDFDVQYLIQQLHSRLSLFMQNVAELFYKAYENKNNLITYDSDNVTEDDYYIADSDSYKISRIVEAAANEITTKGIDYICAKRASNNLVNETELISILDSLLANKDNIPLVREFINLLVTLYFQDNPSKDINDIAFITYSIKPTPNTKNKYMLRKKELLENMLLNNSDNFARRRSRIATESAYFKSFNAYFALLIQKISKNKSL